MMGTGLKQKGKPIFLVCSGWGALGKAVAAVKPRGFLWFGDPLNSWDGRGARGTLMCVCVGGGARVFESYADTGRLDKTLAIWLPQR